MRICLLGPTEHPVAEPFAGGLEAMTHALAAGLGARGHDVTLFAHRDSDPRLPVRLWAPADFAPSPAAARDGRAPSLRTVVEHHQYLDLMTRLAGDLAGDFDVVHHNGLHELPLLLAATLRAPMITTLHTPPLPLWESTLAVTGPRSSFVAVSEHVRRSWSHCLSSVVVRNGLDLTRWRSGDGGGPAVWSGRLVPEKAPHEAIDACRAAGVPLVLAGPVHDREYVEREVTPRLGAGATYLGHLRHEELGDWLRRASVAVVTPAWDEPTDWSSPRRWPAARRWPATTGAPCPRSWRRGRGSSSRPGTSRPWPVPCGPRAAWTDSTSDDERRPSARPRG